MRGLVLCARGPENRNVLVGAAGSDLQALADVCMVGAQRAGGSADPEDWMAWTVDCKPTAALLGEIEARVAAGLGGLSHPAVIEAVFDARHPKLAARGSA